MKTTTIILPSFLRRVLRAYALKAEIRQAGCELQRIGRSRNWRLIGNTEQFYQIIEFIDNANEDSWLWLSKKLKQESEKLSHDHLLFIAKKNSGITINELMAKTDCTVAEARRVIDELEWLDE
ncbi:ribosome recycling factor family protein [Thalassotalea marina]|uniref:Ribosome recycling factor n=1 Tax=Thalassotalea marina TaxID=1673741 RepID=A0A919EN55_9GAMM|nr:ribosome recycling factor family protein [Thalassotalea marina]GHG02620.1 ribosome recycling factor [Thalassotalea marina]